MLLFGCAYTARLPRNHQQQIATTVTIEEGCVTGDIYGAIYGHVANLHFEFQSGTGIILDGRHVLTAYHVVNCSGIKIITVKLFDDQELTAHYYSGDKINDLAVLEIGNEVEVGPMVMPALAKVDIGEYVCQVSARPNKDRICGKITQFTTISGQNVKDNIKTVHGNSGAPVYDSGGQLVGVVTATPRNGDISGFFSSIGDYKDLIHLIK
jgi:S1-C subfamily serine protease